MTDIAQQRRVCLAIGVADSAPLEWLPGAPRAARDIAEWARCLGFDAVTLLTDDPDIGQLRWTKGAEKPVTVGPAGQGQVTGLRIREEILALLPAGEATDWFVLSFAGHGLRRDTTQTLWLPSDWSAENRAVAVEPLKIQLETYGIRSLTIISDACRSYVDNPQTANLTGDSLIPRGKVQQVAPTLDRINAVGDGKPAFMIPGADPADSRCILSGTLINALWGHEPEAFFQYRPDQVISTSLLGFVGTKVNEVSQRYGLEAQPETIRFYGRPATEMVYFDRNGPPNPLSPPVAWPEPRSALKSGGAADLEFRGGAEETEDRSAKLGDIDWDRFDGGGGQMDGAGERTYHYGLASEFPFGREFSSTQDLGPRPAPVDRGSARKGAKTKARRPAPPRRAADAKRRAITSALVPRQRGGIAGANLVVRRGKGVRIWSTINSHRLGRSTSWAVELAGAAGSVIVQQGNLFVPVVIYEGLRTVVTFDWEGNLLGWLCEPQHYADSRQTRDSADVIARLKTSGLSWQKADELAGGLRYQKHTDPVLGVIAAYLYDYAGDRENILRMAYYYAAHCQPVPYDIAMLGLLINEDRSDKLVIPEVQESDIDREGRPDFARSATPAAAGIIGGLCPWLRQGWDRLSSDDEEGLAALHAARGHLASSTFTALDPEGGRMLIDRFNLRD